MTYEELKQKTSPIYPALLLENLMPYLTRKKIRRTLFWFFVLMCLLVLLTNFSVIELVIDRESLGPLFTYKYNLRGLLFISFSLWMMWYLLEMMYFSYFFKRSPIDFEVGQIIIDTEQDDVTAGFLESRPGRYVMKRLGISETDVCAFVKNRNERVSQDEYITPSDVDEDRYVSLAEYGSTLTHFDQEFYAFLAKYNVTPELFSGALGWVSDWYIAKRRKDMWWSRESLARIPSIGRDWSYGKVFLLEKYGYSIDQDDTYISLGDKWRLYADTVEQLENILVKESGNNILLIGKHEFHAREIVSALAKTVINGTSLPPLEDKRFFILDGVKIIDAMKDKTRFETVLHNVFAQSSRAGNIVLVIPRFVEFAESAHALGSDIHDLLNRALSSSTLQVITLAHTSGYHSTLETQRELLHHFEKITIPDVADTQLIHIAFAEASYLERRYKVFFTYQSLVTATESVIRFFTEEEPAVRLKELLQDVVVAALTHGNHTLTVEHVNSVVATKTGIPQGEASADEVEVLKTLEDKMKTAIIGQDAVVTSIVSALKRNRAGISSTNRPIGSFLFLGTTGVGKTETVKALARFYFNNENAITRFDMSEFSGDESVAILIGHGREPGRLTSLLRDRQYGIVLLDEFDKASPRVHDLFLQIFDEGFITDGKGDKVNARNSMFIVTSNAGSQFISQATMQGEDVASQKDLVVNHLITKNAYRAELLNRFDDIIIFNPLGNDELKQIAHIQIKALNGRLHSKSLTIEVSDDLLEYLVSRGNDVRFGAREMNRVIREVLEVKIADAILEKKIKSGSKISFTKNPKNPEDVLITVM